MSVLPRVYLFTVLGFSKERGTRKGHIVIAQELAI